MDEKRLIGRPKGLKATDETKRKISEALKRAWAKQKGENTNGE